MPKNKQKKFFKQAFFLRTKSFYIPEHITKVKLKWPRHFSGGPVVKASPSNARGAGSIPGRGAKIPHASWPKNQNIKQRQYGNKFSKDFKKWST